MMQYRGYKALLIALVYLMTMGGEAFASLCCPCVHHRHEAGCGKVCCHAKHDCSAEQIACEGIHFEAECCKNRHSNDLVLYTSSIDGEVRRLLPVVLRLVVAAKVEDTLFETRLSASRIDRIGPPMAALSEGVSSLHALRAPPVMA